MTSNGSYAKVIGIAGGIGAAVIISIIVYGEMSKSPGGEILQKPTVQWTSRARCGLLKICHCR